MITGLLACSLFATACVACFAATSAAVGGRHPPQLSRAAGHIRTSACTGHAGLGRELHQVPDVSGRKLLSVLCACTGYASLASAKAVLGWVSATLLPKPQPIFPDIPNAPHLSALCLPHTLCN